MELRTAIYLEILATLLFLMSFYLIFFKLHYHESKPRRILIFIGMVLFHPLATVILAVFEPIFHSSEILQIPVMAMLMAGLAVLAGAKENKSVWITAAYFFGAIILIETITTSLGLGLMGKPRFSKPEMYYYANFFPYIVILLAAVAYYLMMVFSPDKAIERIPLPVWIVTLLIQPAGVAIFYLILNPLFAQVKTGNNNFLIFGFSLLALFILNLVDLFLFVKLVSGYKGLSPQFIKKYGLTDREAEIVEALLRGKSDKEIAVSLYIAIDTVKTHLKNIYRKTGAPGRYALMVLIGVDKKT